jgi:hypothetical protein
MKQIFKNQKNRIFSLEIVLVSIISFGILVQSCSNKEEYINDFSTNSKLESLVASSEYRTLNENLILFGNTLKLNYSVLSDTNKDKVITVLCEINGQSNSHEELDKLFEEFNSIMQIDFQAIIDEINVDVVKLNLYREINNISDKEFVLAVNKYSNSNIPRFKNDNSTACIAACAAVTSVCLAACTGPQALAGCHALCMALCAACCLAC